MRRVHGGKMHQHHVLKFDSSCSSDECESDNSIPPFFIEVAQVVSASYSRVVRELEILVLRVSSLVFLCSLISLYEVFF